MCVLYHTEYNHMEVKYPYNLRSFTIISVMEYYICLHVLESLSSETAVKTTLLY